MKNLILLAIAWPCLAFAGVEEDFDSLGGNKIILEKAQALNPETQISIVQERTVPRRNRWEIAPEYSGTVGGDTYVKTQNFGMNVHYHITPRWSLGAKFNKSFNKLTPEGETLIEEAKRDYEKDPETPLAIIPNIDYPTEEQMAYLNWYPIYGKMNLLDMGIAQFDVYGTLGAGQVKLSSSSSPSYSAGGGFGIWWTRNFSTRLEMRYQTYKAQYFNKEQTMELGVGSVQMGWIL